MGMMLLIVLATVCFVLESEATIETGGLYETDALVRATPTPPQSTCAFPAAATRGMPECVS